MLWDWRFKEDFMEEMEIGLVLKEWEIFMYIEMKGQGLVRWREQCEERKRGERAGDMRYK